MNLNKQSPRLGVNIDHFATIRQARGTRYPSLSKAAGISFENGADQITIHLREDRRHIQDEDVFEVKKVCEEFQKPLNFEISTSQDVLDIAYQVKPEWVCLVPEKREERTTEGGLNLSDPDTLMKLNKVCERIKQKLPETKISLFVESDLSILEKVNSNLVDAVEIHTGTYANEFLRGNQIAINRELELFQKAYDYCLSQKYSFHAGHGLDEEMTKQLVGMKIFEEYNIGHWIVAQSLFDSLAVVVRNLKSIMEK
ncbi:pyridoxine 5'-phosphate synthase [Bacteriovoracaceae bacterium]|nr:pyridoxine 5'-phosphate synthase [Bacteriovoracaceae bacterium]